MSQGRNMKRSVSLKSGLYKNADKQIRPYKRWAEFPKSYKFSYNFCAITQRQADMLNIKQHENITSIVGFINKN